MSKPRFLSDEDLRASIVHAARRLVPSIDIDTAFHAGILGFDDESVREYAWTLRRLLVSHDVNTMKAAAERRVVDGRGIHGVFLAPQNKSTGRIAETLALISEASEFDEWRDRIVYLPF